MMPPSSASSSEYFALAHLDRRELAGERVVERGGRAGSEQDDLAHVREVEDARGRADGVVLGEVVEVAHGICQPRSR